jgi:hypothetical protein
MYIANILSMLENSQKILEANDWYTKTYQDLDEKDKDIVLEKTTSILALAGNLLNEIKNQFAIDQPIDDQEFQKLNSSLNESIKYLTKTTDQLRNII